MIPENGAADVKPGPCKIRILFDQDMNTGGMSICGGGENFPEIIGKPRWTSKRAFLMNVRLKPNHDYEFGVNCPSAQNFKSVNGEPAEILLVKFRTAGPEGKTTSSLTPELKQQNRQAINTLQEALANNYSYNDIKNVNWAALFQKYNDSLLNSASPMEFAKTAGVLLANAKDKHIWLMVSNERIPCYINPVTPNANLPLLPKLVPNFQRHNANICTGKFPGGIGYIYIDSWSNSQKKDYDQLYFALNQFANEPGLMIDVRGNGGGSEPLAQEFAGCFIDEPKLYAKHLTINPHDPNHFSQANERILQPNKGRPQYRCDI